jgi:hypothetical protein
MSLSRSVLSSGRTTAFIVSLTPKSPYDVFGPTPRSLNSNHLQCGEHIPGVFHLHYLTATDATTEPGLVREPLFVDHGQYNMNRTTGHSEPPLAPPRYERTVEGNARVSATFPSTSWAFV